MKKLASALAILAAAASTAAVAGEIKQDKKATAPAVSATQMTESEMDKVTAAGTCTTGTGIGVCTAMNNPVVYYNFVQFSGCLPSPGCTGTGPYNQQPINAGNGRITADRAPLGPNPQRY